MYIADNVIAKQKVPTRPLVVAVVVVVHHVTRGVSISYELHDSSIPECVPTDTSPQSAVTLTPFSSKV